ncbi:hypothetical protein [Marinobacter xestospongiae]|uniref:Uncharacterized protein n=1 Tax=Marinobacter xestospongiae TaxID=994319 RepID=A0ABU3VZF4_9GAMM|nr:hypothetical protein [Marinobacter xestospongiae]MDV2079546.1 hypothetical protein [Marinobacter xestospongiae]
MDTNSYRTLEARIRHGSEPDHPRLLIRYLSLSCARAERCDSSGDKRAAYLRAYHTLLEAICDPCVARHWRCLCLDQICVPIIALNRLASTRRERARIQRLRHELSVLSHYFLA